MKSDDAKTKGQRTQERILTEALKLFGKKGFANTSLQQIADACDLSQGAVMQHFSSKSRLLEAVRSFVSKSNHSYVDSRILPTDDGYQSIRKHILLNLDWALRFPAQANVIVLTYESAIHDSHFREISTGAIRLGTERLYRYLLAAQREKRLSAQLDAEQGAEILHTFTVGLVVRSLAQTRDAKLRKRLEETVDTFLSKFLAPKK